MIHAYDKLYLEKGMVLLGRLFDFSVYDLKMDLRTIHSLFCDSVYEKRFATGDASLICGKSGIELAYDLTGRYEIPPTIRNEPDSGILGRMGVSLLSMAHRTFFS